MFSRVGTLNGGSPFYSLHSRKDRTVVVSHHLNCHMSASSDVFLSKLYVGVRVPYMDLSNTNLPDVFMAAVYPDQFQKAMEDTTVSNYCKQILRNLSVVPSPEQDMAMNPILKLMYVKK